MFNQSSKNTFGFNHVMSKMRPIEIIFSRFTSKKNKILTICILKCLIIAKIVIFLILIFTVIIFRFHIGIVMLEKFVTLTNFFHSLLISFNCLCQYVLFLDVILNRSNYVFNLCFTFISRSDIPSILIKSNTGWLRNTVWKFQNFSATQILCEINFGDSNRAKTAIFTILEALNFEFLEKFHTEKCKKFPASQNSELIKWLK